MRMKGNKAKKGRKVKCPKCGYTWKTKQYNKPYICCSLCKTSFKSKSGDKKR